jgi:pimeloyl-ACP methyl ester carboxylesterase
MAANATPETARNVALGHGLFADGSCWSEVIVQKAGLSVTSAQNPVTGLPESVASAERVVTRQDGPTALVGHSFSGMIVTEAGVHPNVSALVYVAARAPDADEDYAALTKTYPTPPATAGIMFDGDEGRLSEEAFLRDFAGDLLKATAKVLYAVQQPLHKTLLTGKTTHATWRSMPSYYAVSTEDRMINRAISSGFRVRDQREMTGLHLDGFGAHPLGPEALEVWIDLRSRQTASMTRKASDRA